jgi:hypothetical protein
VGINDGSCELSPVGVAAVAGEVAVAAAALLDVVLVAVVVWVPELEPLQAEVTRPIVIATVTKT